MNRKLTVIFLISLFFTFPIFAQETPAEQELQTPVNTLLSYLTDDTLVPHHIRNNEFFLESLRLTALAQDAYEYGDYDESYDLSQKAILYARLSDEYVANQLIAEAKRLLINAEVNDFKNRFPYNYAQGTAYYDTAVMARNGEQWDEAIDAAIRAIEILSVFEPKPLLRQYTVRTWAVERDCLWNIAGYPWIYGDPRKWVELYEANKSKLPDPKNPHWIEPGMVLDIPNIIDERPGM